MFKYIHLDFIQPVFWKKYAATTELALWSICFATIVSVILSFIMLQ